MMCLSDDELQMLADNALDKKDRTRALSHIKSCAHCQEQYTQIQSVFTFLESEPAVNLPAGFADAVAACAVGKYPPLADTRLNISVAQPVPTNQVRTKRMQNRIKDIAIAAVVAITLSILLNWLSSNSLGTAVDALGYDLDTMDIPFAYAMLLFTLTIGVFVIDAFMYRRFNKLNIHGRDRK